MRLAALVILAAGIAGPAKAEPVPAGCGIRVEEATYSEPTRRYPHGVLGDDLEWGALAIRFRTGAGCPRRRVGLAYRLPERSVFEDVAPRVVDLDGDGGAEVIVVESDQQKGARLAVWGVRDGTFARISATPFIGTRFRWLAPVGAADLDGDGLMEIAYVDRPHLARVLRVWRFDAGRLTEVAWAGGHSNHRIGERDIAGGIRDCGDGPEMITASADWAHVVATVLKGGRLVSRPVRAHRGRESFDRALACR